GVGAGIETEGGRWVNIADVGQVRAEIVVAQGRVDLFDDLPATTGETVLELFERPSAAGEVGCADHDFFGDVFVDPFAHGRVHRIGVDRTTEKIRQTGECKVNQASARAQHKGPALAKVLNRSHGDVAGLDPRDDVAVVALHQLAQLLQPDLRIDLVIFTD